MVCAGILVGVVRPLGTDVLGLFIAVAGRGVIGSKADRDCAAKVVAVVFVFVDLILDDVDGVPVHALKLAVGIQIARIGQLVAVFEVEHGAVPPGVVGLVLLLGLYSPVCVDGLAT